MKSLTKILAVIVMSGSLGACMFHGGEPKHVSTTTLGQELSDLKTALDNGAITESEYRIVKEELLNTCSHKGHYHKRNGC